MTDERKKVAATTEEYVIEPGARRTAEQKANHRPRKKGIPVPEGCTFQDLSTAQRVEIMEQGESAWKREYNKRKVHYVIR